MKKLINSKRRYRIQYSEGIYTGELVSTIYGILSDDKSELMFALQEITDEVLDLNIGESIYFQCNRDNSESKGIITRIE